MDAATTGEPAEQANDSRTLVRPVAVIIPPAVHARPSPVRPLATDSSAGKPDAVGEHTPSRSGPRREAERPRSVVGRVVVALVALAVIGTVGVALLAGGSGGGSPDDGRIRGEGPPDPVDVIDIPSAPKVTVAGSGARWTFRWKAGKPHDGDEFKLLFSGNGVPRTDPVYTSQTRRVLEVDRGKTVCLTVSLSRDGSPPSAPSEQACVVGQ
jgi:hypothetical protein